MSALAVFLEREGIATVVVGLVRLHLERTQPPRALWVPFELGRPLGGYVDNGQFQKRVLRAALALFDRIDGPVILEDFTEEDPGAESDPAWQPPATGSATSLCDELRMLQPHWKQARARLGRTLSGMSGIPIEQAADYLDRFASGDPAANPNAQMSDLLRMRFCADDIKTVYLEIALASGFPSSVQIGDWFWDLSYAGQLLKRIRTENLEHPDAKRAHVCSRFIVPGARLV